MFRSRNSGISAVLGIAAALLLAGCGSSSPTQSTSPTNSPTPTAANTQVTLLAVPFTVALPDTAVAKLSVTKLTGDYIKQIAPVAATQLNYTGADGRATYLANAYWFDTAQLNKLLNPNEPPPGTSMAVVGDRTLVVNVTVEMPYATDSEDAAVYGHLSELLRDKMSYSQFTCPVTSELPTRAVTPVVRDVINAYFLGKELQPATIANDKETVLDVQQQLVGTHACFNAGSTGEAGYVGSVPAGATDAVMVYVKHKPYPGTGAPATFVTLAKLAGGWSIVAEGTGP